MQRLYNEASFRLEEDYSIKACHSEMEFVERKSMHERHACKELTNGANNVPLKGGGKATLTVTPISTICCGICIAIGQISH